MEMPLVYPHREVFTGHPRQGSTLPETIYGIDTSYQAVNMDRRAEFLFFPKAGITQEI
jgi:hypothetical protein